MTEQDKAMHKGLMKLLNEATFPLQAREVAAFGRVYSWVCDLPERMGSEKKVVPEQEKAKGTKKKAKKEL